METAVSHARKRVQPASGDVAILTKTRISVMEANQQVTAVRTGRDLYNEYLRNRSGCPEWCDLDDADQADWNAKAKEP